MGNGECYCGSGTRERGVICSGMMATAFGATCSGGTASAVVAGFVSSAVTSSRPAADDERRVALVGAGSLLLHALLYPSLCPSALCFLACLLDF